MPQATDARNEFRTEPIASAAIKQRADVRLRPKAPSTGARKTQEFCDRQTMSETIPR
jgi:hypothetical protein